MAGTLRRVERGYIYLHATWMYALLSFGFLFLSTGELETRVFGAQPFGIPVQYFVAGLYSILFLPLFIIVPRTYYLSKYVENEIQSELVKKSQILYRYPCM